MRIRFFEIFLVSLFCLQLSGYAGADTVYTNDGKELKGIIVEDFNDRIILSTADGEKTLMKTDIQKLYFDDEEDNLLKLAEQAQARRDYAKAYDYYEKAAAVNPASKAAKDGIVFLEGYIFRQEEARKEDDIKRREEFEARGGPETGRMREKTMEGLKEELKQKTGIVLDQTPQKLPRVHSVRERAPAFAAGLRKGDTIVSIWGRLTRYMPPEKVMSALLDKPSVEIKCAFERTVQLNVNRKGLLANAADLAGASFGMEFDGLTVSGVIDDGPSFEAGIEKGDLITAVNGKSTRYMPLKEFLELIKNSKDQTVGLTFRRRIIIWRES